MKRSRFSEEQIIAILTEQESGMSVADLCRKRGVSNASIYKWKAKFGGMDVSETRCLRSREDENAKLKQMAAASASWPLWMTAQYRAPSLAAWVANTYVVRLDLHPAPGPR